ncbi:phosphatase PAP2 family protein [Galbibacter sp.]|jgi:undecaprenyl-diphosphatase|uniref:phosphatase PAP2 family protein n=1 Tax=Galbibacter sp. TaxID=2918471 RepID=UPI003A91E145
MLEKLHELDREFLLYINNFGLVNHDGFWLFVTNPISWLPLYLAILIVLWFRFTPSKFYSIFLQILLVLFACGFVTYLVKISVGRLRPEHIESFKDQLRVLSHPVSYSFFSGHTAISFAVTTFVVLVLGEKTKWSYLFFVWPILFSYSRMYLGVHYPSDIIAGALVGVSIALLVYKFVYIGKKE